MNRSSYTPAERAQTCIGIGFGGMAGARLLLRFSDDPNLELAAFALGVAGLAVFCYGVGQFAESRGRSAAWGFGGFLGYLIVRFLLEPRTAPPAQLAVRRTPPPPPPPGYVPTR